MDKSNTHKSGNKSATSSTNRDATNKSISPTTFYGTQSQNPPPLPSRPTAVGSSTTSYYFSSAPSQSKDSSPFREPELVSEDDHMPALASEQDTIPRPFQTYEQTPSTMDTSTDWTESARAGWGEEPANHWSRPVNDNNWETYGGVGSYASVLTADKINIDGRDEDEENDWWNVAVREKHRRPGSGILPPLLADKLHNPLHSLFSVSVSPPDIKIPSFLPSTPSSSSSSPPIASGSSAAPPPFIQPTAEEVRTAVPHPNAYYCTRHNGWVIILWKSSSFFPPLARSFLKNNTVPLLDQARRRKTGSCIGEGEHQRGQANRTHHLHVYERAVDARQLTPAFRRSEWESAMLEKRRRRKVTLHLDELDKDALEKAIEKGEPMEEDEEEEGDLLDLYVCCQCSFYCVASEVIPGVIPVKYIEDFVKHKIDNPLPGKSGHEGVMVGWETILTIVEKRLWQNEGRILPVKRKTFQSKVGWNTTSENIFKALGFEPRELLDSKEQEMALHPPSVDANTPEGRRNRAKLLRAWVELSAWAKDYLKRHVKGLKDFVPHQLWVKIDTAREMYQSAIGAHIDQIPRVSLPNSTENYKVLDDAWLLLGMTPTTYSWELLAFAYFAQCRCDPARTIDYFSAFFAIFSAMNTMGEVPPQELQNLVLEERNRRRYTHENEQESLVALGFGKDGPLGVEFGDDVEDEFIVNAWKDALRHAWRHPTESQIQSIMVNESFRVVAEMRESVELRRLWEQEMSGGMTPDRAYTTLEVPREIDDHMLITIYSVRVEDQPAQGDKMREAMSVIAEARDSARLRQFLETGTDPGDVIPPTRQDWPRGLNQLGNTCYLNSLLQYFYTITDLREAVEPLLNANLKSLDDDKLTDDDLKRHRVGGRLVTRREIVRSKKFVGQLANLFWDMEHSDMSAVTPSIELAKFALVTSKDEEEDDADRGGTDSSNDTDATLVDDAPSRVPASSPGAASSSSVLGKRSRDREQENYTHESQMDIDMSPAEADKENAGVSSKPTSPRRGQAQPGSSSNPGKDTQMSGAPEAEQQMSQKPPLPPRKSASESVMMFGRQHDVSECMDNCIFQIETALLKFDGLNDSEEGKTSVVKRLFYGTLRQRLSVAPEEARSRSSIHEKEDLFSLLPVNVSDEGYDLYDGLSRYFDDVVDFEGKKARMEVTLVDLPPLLQIQLQRGQFDRETLQPYKSQAYVKFGETIYMDRFLDSASPERKERSKAIYAELSTCRDRIHLLTTGKHTPFGTALNNTLEFLQKQESVELPEVNEELVATLNSEQDYLKLELESLRSRAAKLKEEMEEIWQNEHEAAYELTSVFIHRGSSPSWGHYFFYSRHLPEKPDSWFKYNDSDVSLVSKDEVLADTTGSTANPYMLVFVKKGSEVINTVKRFDPMMLEEAEP